MECGLYTQRAWHPRSRYDCNYKVRCVKTLQSRDIRNHPEGKHRLTKNPNR